MKRLTWIALATAVGMCAACDTDNSGTPQPDAGSAVDQGSGGTDLGPGVDGGTQTDMGSTPADGGTCLPRTASCDTMNDTCCPTLRCDPTLNVCLSDTMLPDGGMCGGELDACGMGQTACCDGLVCSGGGGTQVCLPPLMNDGGTLG